MEINLNNQYLIKFDNHIQMPLIPTLKKIYMTRSNLIRKEKNPSLMKHYKSFLRKTEAIIRD